MGGGGGGGGVADEHIIFPVDINMSIDPIEPHLFLVLVESWGYPGCPMNNQSSDFQWKTKITAEKRKTTIVLIVAILGRVV